MTTKLSSAVGILRAVNGFDVPVEGAPLDRPWHAVTTGTPTPAARLFVAHIVDPGRVGDHAFRPLADDPAGTGPIPRPPLSAAPFPWTTVAAAADPGLDLRSGAPGADR